MLLDKRVNQLYLYEILRNFGMELIGIFIPIYIVSQGFGFKYALGFLLVEQATSIIFALPASVFISRFGFKHSIIISYIFLLPSILFLRIESLTTIIIIVSAVIYGLGKVLHSISRGSEFAVDSHESSRDSESSKMLGLPNISRFLGPIAGGYILSFFGFNVLVTISLLFFTTAVMALLKSKDHRDPLEYEIKTIIKDNYSRTFPVFFARGILNITAVTGFALFTFFFIGNEIDTGYVAAIDNLGVILTAAISGKLASKIGRTNIILVGLIGSSIIHFSRVFVSTPVEAVIVSGLGGVIFMLYQVPLFSNYADLAEDEDVLEFYTLNKILFKIGQFVTTLLILGIGSTQGLKSGFQASFMLAGITALTITLWTRKEWM